MQEKTIDKKENNMMKIAIVILLIIILLLLLRSCCDTQPPALKTAGVTLTVDSNATSIFDDELPSTEDIMIPGWGSITMPPNTEDIKVDFYNPLDNEGMFYLSFAIKLGDEQLYSSDLVEPGKHITNISLSHGLDAGTYDAIIRVQPYRMDDKTPTNNADIKTKLYVK